MNAPLAQSNLSSGLRPPIKPPIETTFAHYSDGEEPAFDLICQSVQCLLGLASTWPDDQLDLLIRLLGQRKSLVDEELTAVRLLNSTFIPPKIFRVWDEASILDWQVEPLEQKYVSLLRLISREIDRAQSRKALLKDLLPPSED